MRTIWKFPFHTADEVVLEMPEGAGILAVQVQDGTPALWAAIVNTDAPLVKRRFVVYGTGHDIKDHREMHYIGTYQLFDGALVFHIFEI